ncbi:MAG: hypothetical protein PHS14_12515 [Elusimicrobia bacterium]|nr:hypothetical protein [Elusimicrobiota bacterium]
MNHSITAALALLVTLAGARAGAETVKTDVEPRLQISRFSGKIEVETPNRKESVPGQKLPYIRSGSIVRVVSGTAEFQSDLHAIVRAGKGDAFHYTAAKPESGRRGSMSITAIETEPKALEVAVGGEKFQLKKGGRLTVAAADPGEVNVQSERGDVKIAAGSTAKDGTVRASAHTMSAGESLIIPVREAAGFEGAAMSLAGVSVVRKNDTTFTASGEGRPESASQASVDEARSAVAQWPSGSKMVAEAMIEKYGPPSKVDAVKMSWNDNGAWKKTTVYRIPSAGQDVLEQTIGYDVPSNKRADLSKLDLALKVNPADKEMSVTSESEETNFLAMNLADEVIQEKRSPEDAREFYLTTVKLSQSGKSSPYTRSLLFRP